MGADLWLKADEGLELDARGNGTVVSKWESKVEKDGKKLIATQSSNESARIEGNQTLTGINKAAIFFPPGSGGIGYGYFEIPSNFHLKNSTVLVSLKYEGSAASPQVLSFLAGYWTNDGQTPKFVIDDDSGSRKDALGLYHFADKFELTSNRTKSQSPTYSKGDWTTLSYRIDGNGNMTVDLNGVSGNQTSNPGMASQNTAGKIHIGLSGINRQRGAENLDNAYIYEILIFNEYLDDVQYAEVQSYMQESMDASSVQIVSLPTASPINKGSLLSNSTLTGGNATTTSNGTAVAGKFKWSDGSTTVTQTGNYSVIFVPDSAKFNFSREVKVLVTLEPELNTSANSLLGFRTRNGTASSSNSVSISGTNLTSNVTASVLLGSGFEVSTDNSTFGSNTTIPVVSGNVSAPLYVRLAAAQTSVGNKTATINISFGALSDKSVMLKGTVAEVSDPYIEVTPEVLTLPVTTAGTPSTSANFTVNAYNLSGNLTANATAGLEISLGNGTFSQTLEIPLIGGNVTNALLNLRVAASASKGTLPNLVFLTSGNTTESLAANGTVNAPPPPTPTPPPPPTPTPTPECKCKKGPKLKKSQKCKCGIESNQQKVKKKPKKKKKSVFTFPQVVATSGSTWITAGGNVVSEQDRAQSKTSK
jgi:hypothetical protein